MRDAQERGGGAAGGLALAEAEREVAGVGWVEGCALGAVVAGVEDGGEGGCRGGEVLGSDEAGALGGEDVEFVETLGDVGAGQERGESVEGEVVLAGDVEEGEG